MRIIKKFNSFLNEELVAAVESNPVTTPTPTIRTTSFTLNISESSECTILKAVPDSPFPKNSVHTLHFIATTSKIGQAFNWVSDSRDGFGFRPDDSLFDRANGAWGYPTADSLCLTLNGTYYKLAYSNRGAKTGWGLDIPKAYVIAWTVVAPDGGRWQSNWQLIP